MGCHLFTGPPPQHAPQYVPYVPSLRPLHQHSLPLPMRQSTPPLPHRALRPLYDPKSSC